VGKPAAAHASASGQPPPRRYLHDRAPPPFEAPPTLSQLQAYYDETWSDYRLFWLNRRNLAIHFGYWDESTRTHAESLDRLNAVLAGQIGIRSGQRVLDAGCGVGGSAIWLAKNYGVEVVGITPVWSQVQRARRHAALAGADGVRFEQQDYTATDFPPSSFDVVWAVESVCHARDKRRFFTEAKRLLRPGGRLGMTEYVRRSHKFAPGDEDLLHRWLSSWAIPDLATAPDLRRWAQACGFTEIVVRDITASAQPSLRRLYRLAMLTWPGESLLTALRLRSRTQHDNHRGARVQYRALRRGLWSYAMITATAP
jgi:cyclopropane fatty-acyl-phospholipid synthase-like methyltransferase